MSYIENEIKLEEGSNPLLICYLAQWFTKLKNATKPTSLTFRIFTKTSFNVTAQQQNTFFPTEC